jgi:hypothetical protein
MAMVMSLLFGHVDGEERVAGDPSVDDVLAKKKGHHYCHENQGETIGSFPLSPPLSLPLGG